MVIKQIKQFSRYMAVGAVATMLLTACGSDDNTPSTGGGNSGSGTGGGQQPEMVNPQPTDVVYEANPRFFGTNNCLNALSAQLDRISDLGCNILWIMPICEPGEKNSVGSPYCIKNYEEINPKYGTVEDLQNLVSKAHGLGIKVILDWVPNHTAWDNPWITEHPDWFMQNSAGQIISPPGQNWNDVAQLNYDNPEVPEAMADAMAYWVTTADVDGFRLDYASSPHIPQSFWTGIESNLRAMKSDLILLAECSDYSFYSYGYNMIYDWDSAPTISSAFRGGKPTSIVEEAQGALADVPEGDSILRYVFNHDTMSENPIDSYYGSIDALPAAYVCASMLNGTPLIYSGMDATGLKGTQSFFNYKTITFSDELTPVYRAINDAFVASAEVRSGTLENNSGSNYVAFVRKTTNHNLFVAVNTTNKEISISTPMSVRYLDMTDLINGGSVTVDVALTLQPYGYAIYMN